MKKTDKARKLILKGLSFHLKGMPLKKINAFYNLYFQKLSFTKKDIAFVNYFTNISIRKRGAIETIIDKYIKRRLPKNPVEVKAGIMLGIAQIFFSKVPSYA